MTETDMAAREDARMAIARIKETLAAPETSAPTVNSERLDELLGSYDFRQTQARRRPQRRRR